MIMSYHDRIAVSGLELKGEAKVPEAGHLGYMD